MVGSRTRAALCLSVLTSILVSPSLCDQIATLRRRLQRIDKRRLLFLDETALRLNAGANNTLVLPDEQPLIEATETSAFAARYDMIACCSFERVLLPKIFTPADRREADVKGINGEMLLQFIDDTLAQAVEGLDLYPLILILDRAPIHTNTAAILQAFRDRGSESITEILLMPHYAAKRLSPLDNSIFHEWKEECRRHCPATKENIERIMSDAWERVSPKPHYKHCGLMRSRDPYFDCPSPAAHDQ